MVTDVRDFPAQLGAGSAGADFTAEATFGADFLERMWDDPTGTLYYQVGIGEGNGKIVGDHDIWRLPQADDTYGGTDPADRYIRQPAGVPRRARRARRSAPTSPAATRPLRALLPGLQDHATRPSPAHVPHGRGAHLRARRHAPTGDLQTVIPFGFYPEKEWRDDLEWGATELYDRAAAGGSALPAGLPARRPRTTCGQAAHWAQRVHHRPRDAADTLNLYDVSGLAHFDLYRAISTAGNPSGLETTRPRFSPTSSKQLDARRRPGRDRPIRLRIPVGRVRHDLARRSGCR